MASRFDYVKYDDTAVHIQNVMKKTVTELEKLIEGVGLEEKDKKAAGRAKATALTKLEECYMWIGKAVRDDQISRNGSAPLQEERKEG